MQICNHFTSFSCRGRYSFQIPDYLHHKRVGQGAFLYKENPTGFFPRNKNPNIGNYVELQTSYVELEDFVLDQSNLMLIFQLD